MRYRLHDDVAWLLEGTHRLVAMRLPSGSPVLLDGAAAAIFMDIADGLDPLAESLARWPDNESEVRGAAPQFVRELVERGLVEPFEDAMPLLRPRAAEPEPAPEPEVSVDDAAAAATEPDEPAIPQRPDQEEPSAPRVPRRVEEPDPYEPGDTYRVLFLCVANICRSAYADVAARHRPIPGVEFASAGTHARSGNRMDPPMAAELVGGDPDAHRSQRLSSRLVNNSDIIITMAASQRDFVMDEFPSAARRTFVIGHVVRELADLPDTVELQGLTAHLWENRSQRDDDDVADPYRRGQEVAHACARELDSHLGVILGELERLAGGRATHE